MQDHELRPEDRALRDLLLKSKEIGEESIAHGWTRLGLVCEMIEVSVQATQTLDGAGVIKNKVQEIRSGARTREQRLRDLDAAVELMSKNIETLKTLKAS
jgi:hypothetical protein